MNRQRLLFSGLLVLFPAMLFAQEGSATKQLFAAVVGPSPLAVYDLPEILFGKTTGTSPPNLVNALRQYIERKNTNPSGLYMSLPDSVAWRCVSWPDLRLRSLAVAIANGKPQFLLGADDGVLRPFSNPTRWQLITDWQITQPLDLEVDPFQEQTIYACTAKGIFITYDNGMNWLPANEGLGNLFVNCLVVDPKQRGRLLAGTEGGLYQSVNHGRTWQLLALAGIPVRALLRSPDIWPEIFWVGTKSRGLYESADDGRTFAPVSLGEDSVSVYSLAGGGAGAPIYAGAYRRGIFFAPSTGQSWRHLTGSEKLGSVLCILPMDDRQTIYAGTHDRGVFVSRDAGENWKEYGLIGAQVRQLMLGEPSWLQP